MAKRDNSWTKSKKDRFLQEGRGSGEGKNYKPWLMIQDFPSMGRASRIFGWKSQRIHHLFTDSETRFFYLLEMEDDVIDIREHYPLLNYEDVVKQRDDLNFDYFKDKNSGEYYVLSTSFLITVKALDGSIKYLARSLKASSELEKKFTLERLEIERRYWQSKGNIDWGIITERDISVVRAKNIEWIHSSRFEFVDRGFTQESLSFLIDDYLHMMKNESEPIRVFCKRFEEEQNLNPGTGVFIFKYLLASKIIAVDMNKKISTNDLTSNIEINKKRGKEERVICL